MGMLSQEWSRATIIMGR